MTDTSRFEGWLLNNYDIDDFSRGDMEDVLSKNVGFSRMKSGTQKRILDNWKEFERTIEVVEVPKEVIEEIPEMSPETERPLSFWKKIKNIFKRK